MKWMLVIVFLSTGVYHEPQLSKQSCIEAMMEAALTRENDIWSMVCADPDDVIAAKFETEVVSP